MTARNKNIAQDKCIRHGKIGTEDELLEYNKNIRGSIRVLIQYTKYAELSKKKKDLVKSQLLMIQDFKCAICKRDINLKNCLDHCHNSGYIRGLLCRHCNNGLGQFKDNIDNLVEAIRYLTSTYY